MMELKNKIRTGARIFFFNSIIISFSYSMDVDPVYNIRTGVGLNNLKPDSVRFGPKKLSSSITIDNMSGSLSMFGDNVLLGIGLRHRNSL